LTESGFPLANALFGDLHREDESLLIEIHLIDAGFP
jgi:hypothetical protein